MALLLDQTRSKIDAFLRTVEGLQALDYPFTDSDRVLQIITKVFAELRGVLGTENPDPDSETTKTICRRALEDIENYLPVLGFISRSSDLEAPVELHGPLLRLTRRALQSDPLLVIFSEWNYSPFTFVFPELAKRDVVMVGMPRSESHNALIAPLAGHELGHNIWQRESLTSVFEKVVRDLVLSEMQSHWDIWQGLLSLDKPEDLSDLIGFRYWELPFTWAMRQSEEIFCDFIGLVIFREAYLHAFRYLLAPGASVRRTYNYPDLRERARFHTNAATKLNVAVPPKYVESFEVSNVEADNLMLRYVQLADTVCRNLVDRLLSTATDLASERKLTSHSEQEVSKARNSLRRGVPMTGATGIENILIAAWELHLDDRSSFESNVPAIKKHDKELVLSELILKSFEVFEVEQRVSLT